MAIYTNAKNSCILLSNEPHYIGIEELRRMEARMWYGHLWTQMHYPVPKAGKQPRKIIPLGFKTFVNRIFWFMLEVFCHFNLYKYLTILKIYNINLSNQVKLTSILPRHFHNISLDNLSLSGPKPVKENITLKKSF